MAAVTSTHKKRASTKSRKQNTNTRTSRTQEEIKHDVAHIDFDAVTFDDDSILPNIPAREGYEQRWVRVTLGSRTDARNLSTRARGGWTPRPADTVDEAYQFMLVQNDSMGGIIGTHDLVLMERPMALHRKAKQFQRTKVRELEKAVRHNIFREHKKLGGESSGLITNPKEENTAYVERGVPRVQDDDD